MFLEPLETRRVMAFSPFSDITSTAPGERLAVSGDFSGDGQADLIVSSGSRTQLFVSTNNGDFAAPNDLALQGSSLATGDLNGDGNLDLVSANGIALGSGDGTFHSPLPINLPPMILAGYNAPVPQWAGSVAVGDINGDGTLDLAVTARSEISVLVGPGGGGYGGYYNNYSSGFVNVLLGNGDGTFQPATVVDYPQQRHLESAALAQLNDDDGDGDIDSQDNLDFVTKFANDDTAGYTFLGTGTGSFGAPAYHPSVLADRVLLGDFDEDGRLDLLTRGLTNVCLNRGLAGGDFDQRITFDLGGPTAIPRSLAIGDLNADGHLDIAITTQRVYLPGYGYYDNPTPYYGALTGTIHDGVKVLLGHGDGSFSAPIFVPLGTHEGTYGNTQSSLLADVNGDGRLDLAMVDREQGRLTVALNDGLWTTTAAVSIQDVQIVEGDSGQALAEITVQATGDHAQISVQYSTQDGAASAGQDYTATVGTLTFFADESVKTISVPILGDRLAEGPETFSVVLSNPSNVVVVDDEALITILDNEPTISINHAYEVDPLTVVEGDGVNVPAVFTVTLSQSYDQEVTVDYYTLTGHTSDIVDASGTLHFAPGETSKTITVEVVGDLLDEDLEAFNVYLANASPNATIVNAAGYCYIDDNDPAPVVTIGDVSKMEGNNGTTSFVFTISLSAPSGRSITVSYATANGTATTADGDYYAASGTVTIPAGATSATITILVRGDKKKEANETFYVNLTGATNATIEDIQGVGTILNDDTGGGKRTPAKSNVAAALLADDLLKAAHKKK